MQTLTVGEPSKCCLAPRILWKHYVASASCEWAKQITRVVCSSCRGPADGSRPDDDAEAPWRIIQPQPPEAQP